YIAASSAPHCSQYHSVGKFIAPHSRHLSVRSGSWSSSSLELGVGVAEGDDGAARVESAGIAGWNCAPLARFGDGALRSSSVTDFRKASSSTTFLGAPGFGGGPTLGAALSPAPGFVRTSESSSSS